MKKLMFTLCFLMISIFCLAQNFPACSNFRIEHISLTDSGYIAVSMSNNCNDCSSGRDGCVYAELAIINRQNSADTFAGSNCNCLISPPNNGEHLYLLATDLSVLPNLSEMRFFFSCNHPFCEDVAINQNALAVHEFETDAYFQVYPNPTDGLLHIKYDGKDKIEVIRLIDVNGRALVNILIDNTTIDVSNLSSGLYFLQVQTVQGIWTENIIVK